MGNNAFERKALWAAAMILVLYVSPLYVLGENAHIRVHDNLDSNIAWYRVLVQSGQWFGPYKAVIPQMINGIERNAFGSEFSGIVLLHALFPSMTAYAISQTLTRCFGFLGMYLLLRDHFIKHPDGALIRVGAALAFSLTPFWPSGMLSTLGQPLALWAFLHIRAGRSTWKQWVTFVLLPFYSSFVLGFFFFLAAMFGLWLWDAWVKKRASLKFLGALCMMAGIYLLIEYRLFLSLVLSDEPTSRDEFVHSRLDFQRCVQLAFKNFILGHTHVLTVHTYIVLPLTYVVLLLCLENRRLRKSVPGRAFTTLFAANAALSVWYAFWFHKGWAPLGEQFAIIRKFNFSRFHFLRPLVLYLGFALGCYLLWRYGRKRGRVLAIAAIAGQIVLLFAWNEEIVYRNRNKPSFREFYAVDQFREIADYIGRPKPSYRVASIGLHPAIAQYNGFYTLDTYNNFYSLKYKHTFRKIIARELDKNRTLKTYFDTWGGRCYLFAAELGKKYDYRKSSDKQIRHLEIDTDVFKQLGGIYIFSSVPILNAGENRLALRKTFTNENSAWRIYLYEAL